MRAVCEKVAWKKHTHSLKKEMPSQIFSNEFHLILSNFLWYFWILIRQKSFKSLILLSTRLHADISWTVSAYLEGLTPSLNESFGELQNHLIYWGEISLGTLLLQNCSALYFLQMRKWLIYNMFAAKIRDRWSTLKLLKSISFDKRSWMVAS